MADVIHDAVEAAWQDGFAAGQQAADADLAYAEGYNKGYDDGALDAHEAHRDEAERS